MKKFLAASLSFLLAISLLPISTFAANNTGSLSNFKRDVNSSADQFSDISNGKWYTTSVEIACEYGLMKGTSDATFSPSGNITIAETITLASRLHSIYYNDGKVFENTKPWYQAYVDYALDNHIISAGYDDYTKAASRATFAVIICGALPSEALKAINNIPNGKIPDVPSYASYATSVYVLYNAGILTGNDTYGTFTPEASICRDAVATIVTRMANVVLRKNITLKLAATLIYLSATSISIDVGATSQVTATVLPNDATDKTITWYSRNTSVATVSNNGVITGTGSGTTIIEAQTNNGLVATCQVNITTILTTKYNGSSVSYPSSISNLTVYLDNAYTIAKKNLKYPLMAKYSSKPTTVYYDKSGADVCVGGYIQGCNAFGVYSDILYIVKFHNGHLSDYDFYMY